MSKLEKLFRQYCHGWEAGTLDDILSPLHNDIYIKECFGPEYHGTTEVKSWAVKWLVGNSKVRWKIKKILLETSFLASEWRFSFQKSDTTVRSFDGSSFVVFKQGKISTIHEYWQTGSSLGQF